MKFLRKLIPALVCNRIWDIQMSALAGVRLLILDLDNTLALPKKLDVEFKALKWIEDVRRTYPGIKIVILSNLIIPSEKRFQRLARCADQCDADHFVAAYGLEAKPNPVKYLFILKLMGCEAASALAVGDQILTDVRGSNRAGIRCCLVLPQGKDKWYTAWKRWIEFVIRKILKF